MDLARVAIALGERPALLLVDMSCGFCDPQSPLGGHFDDVVRANVQLLQAFRARALPRCFTTVSYRDAAEAQVFRRRLPALNILEVGSRWVNIDPRLEPEAGEPVFSKLWASAFFGTGLADWLQQQRADSLVITGLTTSGCVRASVVDALQHDYPVQVPREAVGDRNSEAHAANLHDMHAKYAEVVNVDDVLRQLRTGVAA